MCNCKGDANTCGTCRFWSHDGVPTKTKWGVCAYFTDNPGAPMKMYSGNWKQSGSQMKTTDGARCPNYAAS